MGVRESTAQGLAETGSIASCYKTRGRLVYEQVEERIVGCGDRPPEAGMLRAPRLPSGKMTSLAKKIAVQAHCSTDSERPRKRTYTHGCFARSRLRIAARTWSRSLARVRASTSS